MVVSPLASTRNAPHTTNPATRGQLSASSSVTTEAQRITDLEARRDHQQLLDSLTAQAKKVNAK